MAKNTAVDVVGRPTSKDAQKIHDAKTQPVTNLASNKKIADRAAKFVSDFLSRIQASRTNLEDRLTVFYGLWNGDSVADYFPTARPVHVPEPFKAVEGFVPRAANLLVEQPGWFRVVGIDDQGKKNAEVITKLLKAQLKRDNFDTKIRSVLRDTAIYGYCPSKVFWKKRRRKIKYNKVTKTPSQDPGAPGEKLKLQRGKETEINLDGPTLEHVDVYDFFNDLRFKDIQDSPGIIFRQERFEHELIARRDSGDYVNVDALISSDIKPKAVTTSGPPGTMMNPATYQQIRDFTDGISVDIYSEKHGHRMYEIFEFWGLFDKDWDLGGSKRGTEKEYVITLGRKMGENKAAGGWIPLRIAENPFWHGMRPAICAHYSRRSHVFQSIGVIEPIVSLSAELDDSRNIGLAARALEAKPAFIASDDADLYQNNFVIDPGSVLRGRTTDCIRALHVPKVSDSAFRSEEILKSDIRETTGIISTYQGSSDAASETATSIVNRTREANKRIAEVAKNVAQEFLVPMLEMFHSLNQQMITKEKMVELIGEDGLTVDIQKVSPEEVAGQVGFEITCLPEIEIAGLKTRMLNEFLDRAVAIAPVAPNAIRYEKLLQMAWRSQFGAANIDEVFTNANAPLRFRSAMDEAYIVGMGHNVEVQEGENYMEHFRGHQETVASKAFQNWPEDAKMRMLAHLANTESRLRQEMERSAPRTPQEAMMQQGVAPQGQQPGMPQQPGGPTPGMVPRPGGGTAPPRGPTPGGPQATTESAVRSAAASNAPRTPGGGQ
jgi:hypothetical protein